MAAACVWPANDRRCAHDQPTRGRMNLQWHFRLVLHKNHRHQLFRAVLAALMQNQYTPINPDTQRVVVFPPSGYPDLQFASIADAAESILAHGGLLLLWKEDLDMSLWLGSDGFDDTLWSIDISFLDFLRQAPAGDTLYDEMRAVFRQLCMTGNVLYGYIADDVMLEDALHYACSVYYVAKTGDIRILFLENYIANAWKPQTLVARLPASSVVEAQPAGIWVSFGLHPDDHRIRDLPLVIGESPQEAPR